MPARPTHFADPVTMIFDFADLVTTIAPGLRQMSHRGVSRVVSSALVRATRLAMVHSPGTGKKTPGKSG
jgi:hypothetical protein